MLLELLWQELEQWQLQVPADLALVLVAQGEG